MTTNSTARFVLLLAITVTGVASYRARPPEGHRLPTASEPSLQELFERMVDCQYAMMERQTHANRLVKFTAAWRTQEMMDTATVALDSAMVSLLAFSGAYYDFRDELVMRGIVTDYVAGDVCPDRPTAR